MRLIPRKLVSHLHPALLETTNDGAGASLHRLTRDDCSALGLFHVKHAGFGTAGNGFCMVRTHLPGAFLIGTLSGSGWVRMDGRWTRCQPGWMCLSPPHVLQGCHSESGEPWRFVWCRWDSLTTPPTLVRPDTPLLRRFDPEPLRAIIEALRAEASTHRHSTVTHHLVEALQATVLNFTGAFRGESRLATLWDRVASSPGEKWTVERMASLASCSREHLRRLCRESLGRTPQEQLAWIRLRRAAQLITTTTEKLETIAADCGYSSGFALSNSFQRWMGLRPSKLRPRR